MRNSHDDLRPTRPRARALPPGWLVAAVALAPLLLASCTDGGNACDKAPVGVGAVATDVQAAGDPCAGKPVDRIVAWFTRQGVRYPLRCGRRDPRGFGYVHIRYDEGGHGDPVNDPACRAEVANALEQGIEHLASGGTWRYTVKFDDAKAICVNARYFRVVLARSPNQPDGHPAGIITALHYANQPDQYP